MYLTEALGVGISRRVDQKTVWRVELQTLRILVRVDTVSRLVMMVKQVKHRRRRQAPVTTRQRLRRHLRVARRRVDDSRVKSCPPAMTSTPRTTTSSLELLPRARLVVLWPLRRRRPMMVEQLLADLTSVLVERRRLWNSHRHGERSVDDDVVLMAEADADRFAGVGDHQRRYDVVVSLTVHERVVNDNSRCVATDQRRSSSYQRERGEVLSLLSSSLVVVTRRRQLVLFAD